MFLNVRHAFPGAVALVLGLATPGQGHATIVVNGAAALADPIVESGGHRLPPQSLGPGAIPGLGIVVVQPQSIPVTAGYLNAGYLNNCRGTAPRRPRMANFAFRFMRARW
jgi:hypothetical protein